MAYDDDLYAHLSHGITNVIPKQDDRPRHRIETDYTDHLLPEWVLDKMKEAFASRGWDRVWYEVHYQETGAPYRWDWYGRFVG